MSKIDHSLFSAHEHALEHTFGDCPECGSHLHIRNSKSGPFIGCSAYPKCTFSKPLHDQQTTTLKEIAGALCPECGHTLAIKKGRYGMFIGCTDFPQCHYIEPIKKQEDTHFLCPQCKTGHIIERTNKYGKRFYACNHYPKCKYVVNSPPVAGTCPDCGWTLLIAKKGKVCCPQPNCDFQVDP
ncbi:DNA topoisomerase family protein [Alteromonas sp. 14N.309.X.WAT.G.H12]|uniref:DNA topoisomerase family protein n=1 Tax=Alteromonas sp. 14N.309.X.WAT.G.H12 TaxID=3120824 RepID=UPI002FD78174